jgi:hypothetical protein
LVPIGVVVINYVRTGPSNGALPVFAIANYTEPGSNKVLTQGQEDTDALRISLLYSAKRSSPWLNACWAMTPRSTISRYVGKYNVGYDVPYTLYKSYQGDQTVISENARGTDFHHRPQHRLWNSHSPSHGRHWSNMSRGALSGRNGESRAEYVGKYNVGYDVPYTLYKSYQGDQTVISEPSTPSVEFAFTQSR